MRRPALLLAALFALASAPAHAGLPGLEQIMEHPDWIGPPVEEAWWSLDGRDALYRIKRPGSPLRATHAIDLRSGRDGAVGDDRLASLDGPSPVFDRDRRRALFLRQGDLFLRELRSGRLVQLSRGVDGLADPRFMLDGRVLARDVLFGDTNIVARLPSDGGGGPFHQNIFLHLAALGVRPRNFRQCERTRAHGVVFISGISILNPV